MAPRRKPARPANRLADRLPGPAVESPPPGVFDATPGVGKALLGTPAATTAAYFGVTQEVGELKKAVGELTTRLRDQAAPPEPGPNENRWVRRLVERHVSLATARCIVDDARNADEPFEPALRAQIAKRLPAGGAVKRKKPGKPHVVALVGPTGVGKTTTIAKLAAGLKLREGAKVALITIDTYRIAAIDQLKKYAEIIDAPLQVVGSPAEVKDAMARVADHDYVLIDTAGRSPRDAAKLGELRAFLDSASPDETHLVLSATCGREAMLLAARRFAGVEPQKLTLTKLDEAAGLGAVLDVVAEHPLPVSYLTAGQDVPDDLELCQPDRLVTLILDDGV
jgi:flagellar biosynthesis protein FlhF